MQGKLAGTVRLTMPEGKASKGTGSVSLEVQDMAVGDGKAKIKGALALPKIEVGTLDVRRRGQGRRPEDHASWSRAAKTSRCRATGAITMRETGDGFAAATLQIRFRINDAYRAKSDITKSLFGAPGSNAPALFELADPKIKQSKRPDGFYGWSFRGPLSRPEIFPAGIAGSTPASPLGGGFPSPKP